MLWSDARMGPVSVGRRRRIFFSSPRRITRRLLWAHSGSGMTQKNSRTSPSRIAG